MPVLLYAKSAQMRCGRALVQPCPSSVTRSSVLHEALRLRGVVLPYGVACDGEDACVDRVAVGAGLREPPP